MTLSWKPIAISSAGVVLLAGAVLLLTPSPAQAQCGSQASSCKNCHEVQAQDPVNTEGDWHTSHAFGDFCEFCHAGNVQATDADTAHQGMVEPLADPQASCSACHPNDAHNLAVGYGAALGVEVGAGVGPSPSAAPTQATPPTAAPAAPAAEPPAGEAIDFNALYAETVEGRRPISTGNLILGIMIAALVLGGGGYIFWRERRGRLAAQAPAEAPTPAEPVGTAETSAAPAAPAAPAPQPETLLTAVASLDPLGRRALERLLGDPAAASHLLQRLAKLDPAMIRALRGLDRETRALLLALTSD
jgi:hypothetical protein